MEIVAMCHSPNHEHHLPPTLLNNFPQQPLREGPQIPRIMLIKRRPRPIRIPHPLQRVQITIETRLDSLGRDAELVGHVAVVGYELWLGGGSGGDAVCGFELGDVGNDGGFYGRVRGEGGGGAVFYVFEAGEAGWGYAVERWYCWERGKGVTLAVFLLWWRV